MIQKTNLPILSLILDLLMSVGPLPVAIFFSFLGSYPFLRLLVQMYTEQQLLKI